MKTKKSSSSRSSDERTPNRNAFSFIKNKFFVSPVTTFDQYSMGSPRSSISTHLQPLSSEVTKQRLKEPVVEKYLKKDSDPWFMLDSSTEADIVGVDKTRPVSMMCVDSAKLQSLNITTPGGTSFCRRNSTSTIPLNNEREQEKRNSLIIIKEGYLYKKSDLKPFHRQVKSDRGWKPYRVVLRGHKLYLYKLATETFSRAHSPSSPPRQQPSSSTTPADVENKLYENSSSMRPILSEFDEDTRNMLSKEASSQLFGFIFAKLDPNTKECIQHVYLVLTDDMIYVCSQINALWTSEAAYYISSVTFKHHSQEAFVFSLFHQQATIGMFSIQRHDLGQAWISTLNSRMYDATQNCYRSHRFGNRCTTIHALICQLLNTEDETFLDTFLLTWPTFATGTSILKEIELCLKHEDHSKVVNLLKTWCRKYSLDVMGDLATSMMSVLNTMNCKEAEEAKALVLEVANQNARKSHNNTNFTFATTQNFAEDDQDMLHEEENIQACQVDGIQQDSINLSNLFITGMTPHLFLSIDPDSFAQQVYLYHASKYDQFKADLLNPVYFLLRSQAPVQITNALMFTSASPHFLTKTIRTHILVDSQHDDLVKDHTKMRSQLLNHWIRIGRKLYDLGDMIGWSAVSLGVCSFGIVRLRETWKLLDRDLVCIVQGLWVPILVRHRLLNQDIGSEFETKEEILQSAQVLQMEGVSLPFFGTVRQAVDRYRRHATNALGSALIDFEEAEFIYQLITTSLSTWQKKQIELKAIDTTDILPVCPLQSYFEYLVTDTMSVPHELKHLQEWSLACEPKVFDQKYSHGKSKLNQSPHGLSNAVPPSTALLTFPKILDSCTILNSCCQDTWQRQTKPKKSKNTKSILDGDFFVSSQKGFGQPSIHVRNSDDICDDASSSSKQKRRSPKRTYSFPPGTLSSVDLDYAKIPQRINNNFGLLKQEDSRVWLDSEKTNKYHHTFSAKSLTDLRKKDSKGQGDILLNARYGNLVFKAIAASERVQKDKGIDCSTLFVTIKAGCLKQLVDVLVAGVSPFENILIEQWHVKSLVEGIQQQKYTKIVMDEKEYRHIFFVTFRTFCSSCHLVKMLQERFMDAKNKAHLMTEIKPSLPLSEPFTESGSHTSLENSGLANGHYDWKKLAMIQLRILNILIYWIEEHPCDFVDEVQTIRNLDAFLNDARTSFTSWSKPLKEKHKESEHIDLTETWKLINECEQCFHSLYDKFTTKVMTPIYDFAIAKPDIKLAEGIRAFHHQLMNGKQRYHVGLQTISKKSSPFSFSSRPFLLGAESLLDSFSSEALLDQINQSVRCLFNTVAAEEWIQLFDVFNTQASDLHAWMPASKPSKASRMERALANVIDAPQSHPSTYHILLEEVVVSDIFTAIEGAKRSMASPSTFSDDDLFLAFPTSIQYLYCLHFVIRSWVMNEITNANIDAKTRVMRIEKFLQMISSSKSRNENLTIFPEGRIPGFVEYAIASALVSPEVRTFSKAWLDVAIQHSHASLSTLESLLCQTTTTSLTLQTSNLSSISSINSESSFSNQKQNHWLVPSLGWIFERMLELCFHVPQTYQASNDTINFDKNQCISQFLQLIASLRQSTTDDPIEPSSVHVSLVLSPSASQYTWRDLRELASQENKKHTSNGLAIRGGHRTVVFNKLVNEQLDKLKKYFKDKDRIDKEWFTFQQKLQKKQTEQAKQIDKQDRKTKMIFSAAISASQSQNVQHHSVMPRINSFLKGLRPHSMASFPSLDLKNEFHVYPHSLTTKASTVISLIHATTSVAITYTRRDFVFRIVTEDGGQYLLQAADREDMHNWVQHINSASKQGAAKRQSVLATESATISPLILSDNTQARGRHSSKTSAFGVPLQSLMKDNTIPLIVEKCIQEIEKRGLEEVGIYRIAGTGSTVNALRSAFNKDVAKVYLGDPIWADINIVADILKQFLRELPEPLTTYECYDELVNAAALENHDERICSIKAIIKKLPEVNYILLKRIIEHFVIVTDYEATNHMYATNLAIVFGPTLLQPIPSPISFATTISNIAHHQTIVKYLILNYHYLFDIDS